MKPPNPLFDVRVKLLAALLALGLGAGTCIVVFLFARSVF
jgi:hypothetical protein